ncbi:DUF924 family protein [Shewanella sp. SR44-3]|uniref:DUF924 family protein n=1 Tax=unclassified Shewanella TaxID=196818 RepID=UPI0015FC0BC1|nr:DUF924 family protein [Shewanella sp. SR44-3]MBB1270041.1 DUF924 domain-containing protein [Shewanella sp. SR44-3]
MQNSSAQAQSLPRPEDILQFWFEEISPKQWWQKDLQFDAMLRQRYQGVVHQAMAGELWQWRTTDTGRLAEIIVLDQFTRNIYRDTPMAFSADGQALILAQEAVLSGCLTRLTAVQTPFLLMPYMHSESVVIHQQAVPLFKQYASNNYDFELRHQAIIQQFGRYPHRNAILNRPSSAAETAFLQQPGSSF